MNSNSASSDNIPRVLSMMEQACGELRRSLNNNSGVATNADVHPSPNQLSSNITERSNRPIGSTLETRISSLSQFRQMLSPALEQPDRNFHENRRTILNETRREFRPYPRSSTRASRRQNNVSSARDDTTVDKEWVHIFFALGSPEDVKTPKASRISHLESYGLGAKVLRINYGCTSNQLASSLIELFPRLQGQSFELMKGVGGGAGKLLTRLSLDHAVPDLLQIITTAGRAQVYVRPVEDILTQPDDNDTNETSTRENEHSDAAPHNTSEEDGQVASSMRQHQLSYVREDLPDNAANNDVILKMDDFRNQLYQDNPGTQVVFVQRDDFCTQVLGVYKNPAFNLLQKPQIIFAGEAGSDVGALQKEYFWCGIQSIICGKFNGLAPLLEGVDDHKIPTQDASLFRSGIFKLLGKFLVHSALHSGVAFVGLSQAIAEYLFKEHVDPDTPITISVEDIPNYETRDLIIKMDEARSVSRDFVGLDDNLKKSFNELAQECGFNEDMTAQKYMNMREHILYHYVIEKRRPALDSIKASFIETKLLQFLQGKEYLLKELFPSTTDIPCRVEWVINRISGSELTPHMEFVKSFIRENCSDPQQIRALLAAWTGWPIPSEEEELKIEVVEDGTFIFHSCFSQLEIPSQFLKPHVYAHLKRTLEYGHTGFGTV